jgi:O-antigen ligase
MSTNRHIGQLVIACPIVTTILITPFLSFDSLTAPRLVSITTFGAIGVFYLFQSKEQLMNRSYRIILISSLAFLTWMLISLLVSGINFIHGFYGISRRNMGMLTFVGLVSLMLCAVVSSNRQLLRQLSYSLIWLGFICGIYGVIQSIGLDPIDWINIYSPVISIFGNPNFHSSFMGIAATAAFAMILDRNATPRHKFFLFGFILVAILNIVKSQSLQGFFVFYIGLLSVLHTNAEFKLKSKKYKNTLLVFSFMSLLIAILDILQRVPWNPLFYKESISYRGDFWRAGIKMTFNHPIFGVGPDGYVDKYRESRDLIAASRFQSESVTDSAHNLFIDLSSSGGVPLFLIYILLVGLTFTSAIKVIRRSENIDAAFVAIFASWMAHVAQSVISVNPISLALWGWVFMGVIIGNEISSRESNMLRFTKLKRSNFKTSLGLVMGISISFPIFIADANFRSAIESGNPIRIRESVKQWPQSIDRMNYASEILREADFPELSLAIAREAVTFNQANFEAWKELSLQKNVSINEKKIADEKMKILDPWNPNLK